MNLITIKGGCTLGIIYPNDQKNQPINFSAKTVIHDGVTVFADSEVSGEITESRIEAYSVIRNGQYKFDGKDKPNSGRVRRSGTRGRRIDSDAHYQTDNR